MKKGFTLVELLVVVTIIGVLAAIGLTVYSSAQKSGRIAKRAEDLSAIKTALELYNSQNKTYPISTNSNWASECGILGGSQASSDQVVPGLVPNYMVAFPADPSMKGTITSSSPCYGYKSNGVDYKVVDLNVTEMTSVDFQNQRNFVDPARDGTVDCTANGTFTAWAVYTTGGCSW